jgi:FKBP-type peptidyl-prolyl cis-trans isomerase SlyD
VIEEIHSSHSTIQQVMSIVALDRDKTPMLEFADYKLIVKECTMSEIAEVKEEVVVSMAYELTVDGEMIDSSNDIEGEAIAFIQGLGQIIPGLEKALYGMKVGESKEVKVPAKEAYGEVDNEAFIWVPRDDFPDSIPLEVGTVFEMREQDGDTLLARISELGEEQVRVDLNHPLAGKTLQFKVQIMELRAATKEELEHGHVHQHGGHDH